MKSYYVLTDFTNLKYFNTYKVAQAYASDIGANVCNVNLPASIHTYGYQLGQRAKTLART